MGDKKTLKRKFVHALCVLATARVILAIVAAAVGSLGLFACTTCFTDKSRGTTEVVVRGGVAGGNNSQLLLCGREKCLRRLGRVLIGWGKGKFKFREIPIGNFQP